MSSSAALTPLAGRVPAPARPAGRRRPAPGVSPLAAALGLALGLGGCALQRHEPAVDSPARAQAAVRAASPDDAEVRVLLARQGIDTRRWPLPVWDGPALRALALALYPQVRLARAERAQALAQREADRPASRPGGWTGLETTLEHHSANGAAPSPWSLGVVLELGLSERWLGTSRREAREAAADALADEALAQTALAVWQVHRQARDAHRAWTLAAQRADLAEAVARARREEAAAWQRRLALGAVDGREAGLARQREAEAVHEADAARAAALGQRVALAAALGVSAERAAAMVIAREDLLAPAAALAAPGAPQWQEAALLDRLDVRAGVARYAAADAALRLELARQLPEIVLKPGWAWDQGDRRWSLGVGLSLPPVGGNRAGIAQASARRDAEAARFAVLQAQALGELDAARAAAAAAEAALQRARGLADAAVQQSQRVQRRLAAGSADRLEVLEARRAVLEAQGRVVDARAGEQQARAALEDVLQRPLDTLAGPRADLLAGGPR